MRERRVAEFVYSRKEVPARRAAGIGLVNRVWDDAEAALSQVHGPKSSRSRATLTGVLSCQIKAATTTACDPEERPTC